MSSTNPIHAASIGNKPKPKVHDLRITRTGLRLVYTGVALGAVAAITAMIMFVLDSFVLTLENDWRPEHAGIILTVFSVVQALLGLASFSLTTVGQFLCFSAPKHNGARLMAILTILFKALAWASLIGNSILIATRVIPGNFIAILPGFVAASLLFVASFLCFVSFNRRIADGIANEDVANYAIKVRRTFIMLVSTVITNWVVITIGELGLIPLVISQILALILLLATHFLIVAIYFRYTRMLRKSIEAIPAPSK